MSDFFGMATKMDVIHLKKEELQFELRFRGIDPKDLSVDGMRASLRSLIRLEKANQSLRYEEYQFDSAIDYPQIITSYQDLEKLINDFNAGRDSPGYRRICSRLYHLLGRVDTIPMKSIPTVDCDPEHSRSGWIVKITTLIDQLEQVALRHEKSEQVGEAQGLSGEAVASPSPPELHTPLMSSTTHHHHDMERRAYAQPIQKWNLKFSGSAGELSVVSFLERVEELKTARHIRDEELYKSAVDLFEGKALLWYRSNAGRCHNWHELSKLMKTHFLPPDYQTRLYQEILLRTQGVNEPIIEYLSCIRAMFRRHGNVPDDVQLEIVSRNLAPFYLMQLPEVTCLEDLEAECLKLEVKKFRAENYRSPTSKSESHVEPELSCTGGADTTGKREYRNKPIVHEVRVETRQCWRCNKKGHLARNCTASVGIKCFTCGKLGVTRRNCPQCGLNQPGNGR